MNERQRLTMDVAATLKRAVKAVGRMPGDASLPCTVITPLLRRMADFLKASATSGNRGRPSKANKMQWIVIQYYGLRARPRTHAQALAEFCREHPEFSAARISRGIRDHRDNVIFCLPDFFDVDAVDSEQKALSDYSGSLVDNIGAKSGTDQNALVARGSAIVKPLDDLGDYFDAKTKEAYAKADERAQGV